MGGFLLGKGLLKEKNSRKVPDQKSIQILFLKYSTDFTKKKPRISHFRRFLVWTLTGTTDSILDTS